MWSTVYWSSIRFSPTAQLAKTLFEWCAELGTWQHCRDNVTMFSGQLNIDYYRMSIILVATPLRHRGLNMFSIFSFVTKAPLLYHVGALSLSRG